jgi:hypothetical protein
VHAPVRHGVGLFANRHSSMHPVDILHHLFHRPFDRTPAAAPHEVMPDIPCLRINRAPANRAFRDPLMKFRSRC